VKVQVSYMVQQLLRLARPPAPSDAADGVAVALTYLLTQRRQLRAREQDGRTGRSTR
jgi:Holliday junction resolvasome RuvABC endonuclease subunit